MKRFGGANNEQGSRALNLRIITPRSPSPQSSPSGRGRTTSRVGTKCRAWDEPTASMWNPFPMNLLAGARRLRRFSIQRGKAFEHGSGVNAALRFIGSKRELSVGGILSLRERAGVRGKDAQKGPVAWRFSRLSLMIVLLSGSLSAFAQATNAPAPPVRFQAVDVFVDGKDQPLAAYQVEISAPAGAVKIAGIEGGEHPAFQEPPFYDLRALQHERVIIAAFNTRTADKLPKGRTRVATLHVQVSGEASPAYEVKLQTAATLDGRKIEATAKVEERKQK
jgi:hypothetical protein